MVLEDFMGVPLDFMEFQAYSRSVPGVFKELQGLLVGSRGVSGSCRGPANIIIL